MTLALDDDIITDADRIAYLSSSRDRMAARNQDLHEDLRSAVAALKTCQSVLAMIVEPKSIQSTSLLHAFAQAVTAEASARDRIATLTRRHSL